MTAGSACGDQNGFRGELAEAGLPFVTALKPRRGTWAYGADAYTLADAALVTACPAVSSVNKLTLTEEQDRGRQQDESQASRLQPCRAWVSPWLTSSHKESYCPSDRTQRLLRWSI